MFKNSILIVDDEPKYLELLKGLLEEEGYQEIATEQHPNEVMSILETRQIDLIIMDVYMPEMNGMVLLEKVHEQYPQIPVIMVTAVDEIEIALRAIRLGAYEYIIKPPKTERLFLTIKRALEQRLLELQLDSHRSALMKAFPQKDLFQDIISASPLMFKVFELVEIFAPTNEIVLITGETGTGKDLIAKKIHDLSPRQQKPFVVVNLASISSSLFESELFGHERGSFTGATAEKLGYFETANGGTIFLDEIGELPKELQGKLLRAIQYNEIYRIGSAKPIKLDIRIIAATNKELIQAIENKDFRADLYYRLTRGLIHLPKLKERGDDVVLLAKHFLNIGNETYKKNIPGFSKEAINTLKTYDFPGNIRELENIILNAVAKSADTLPIGNLEIPGLLRDEDEPVSTKKTNLISIDAAVQNHIMNILDFTKGNIRKTAYILGISERTLQRKLKTMREQNLI